MTQFMAGKATKSNPLLLPTSALLITFENTGNIALHFGEVEGGTIRSAGGLFPLTFCILLFLLKKKKRKKCSLASYSPGKLVLAWELMGKSEPVPAV